MQTYAYAVMIAIPMFSLLVLLEGWYGARKGFQTLHHLDTISSLSSGITNVIKDSLGLVVIIVSYPFLERSLAVLEIETTWLVYLVGFVAIDFAGYWSHRLNHTVNSFWNNHVIHHSSEEFNLACALRQTISSLLGIYALFLIPAAILGIPPKVITLISPIHLFLQFWYHTRHLPRMGVLEYLIITPSQHRVHHAINPIYIDKNFGQIFTWWDRMFGTFQEELDEVPPVYGVTRPARTWNPIKINFQHLWLLMQDAWRTDRWIDKLRIWFMPTGWRPSDVVDRYPVAKIDDPYSYQKYNTEATPRMVAWSWLHFVVTLLLLMFMLYRLTDIGFPGLLIYGGFIFVGIYGYTTMMDGSQSGQWIELGRGVAGVATIVQTGGWFGIDQVIPLGSGFVLVYFLITALGGLYFGRYELPRRAPVLMSTGSPVAESSIATPTF